MKGRTKRTPERDAKFLSVLGEGLSVSAACKLSGYARTSAYEYREADPEFREGWEQAVLEGGERLEDEVIRRAVTGVLRPIYYGGKICGEVREFSDILLIFRLKALFPDKYRERVSTEMIGKFLPLAAPVINVYGRPDRAQLDAPKQ